MSANVNVGCGGPFLLFTFLDSFLQVTVFKNLTNIVIVTGDWWFFHQSASCLVILSMAVMVFGALVASFHDLHFR